MLSRITNFALLATAAAGLAACACETPQPRFQSQEPVLTKSYTPTTTYVARSESPPPAPVAVDNSGCLVYTPGPRDFAHREEYCRNLQARLDSASREISSFRSGSAPGTECERRMRQLEPVADSTRVRITSLSSTDSEQWATKTYDVENRLTGLEQSIRNERALCTASR